MRISRLSVNLKRPNKINLFVDGKFVGVLSQETVAKYALYKDKLITEQDLEEILKQEAVYDYKVKVIELINKRPRSEKELRQYLEQKFARAQKMSSSLTEEIIETIISELKQKQYLNDAEFASWWIDNRNQFRGRSRAELQQELYKKGIDREIIENSLQNQVINEQEIIKELLNKKLKSLAGKGLSVRQQQQKAIAYLLRKGFAWEEINKYLKN